MTGIAPVRPYDAVFFDIDHTLALDHKVELVVLEDMVDELSPNQPQAKAAFMERANAAMDQFRQGQVPIHDAMAGVFSRLGGVDPQHMATTWMQRVVDAVPRYLEPAPGAVQLLADLRQAGYPLGIITNGWDALQQKKAALLGFEGPIFVSDAMGCWKPDRQAFLIPATAMRVDPRRCAYIGDTAKSDMVGAGGVGMTTMWINELHQPYPGGLLRPDYEVQEVADVRSLLLPFPGQFHATSACR